VTTSLCYQFKAAQIEGEVLVGKGHRFSTKG